MKIRYNNNITLELTRSARTYARELDSISREALVYSCDCHIDPFAQEWYLSLCGDESARIREALVSTFYEEVD